VSPVTKTPLIPVSVARRPVVASLTDTPPPTILFGPPPPPPAVYGSSGSGSSLPDIEPNPGPAMPEVGDEFQGFYLAEELGRGTFGRVFLAHQLGLARRPVALKVTLRATREPERLARLQHTNVVPVYSVHAAGPVQLICMPLLGRHTLADALKTHRSSTGTGWSKRATRAQRGSTTVTTGPRPRKPDGAKPAAVPAGDLLAGVVGEPTAVLRLLSQLAAGLGHAHGRGILHLDIKPGNVLLADTGEPMLLDFNLSSDAAETDRELVGGTVPYMAPEQLLDMRSRGKGGVDARTDLYALGVVAFELLAGEPPFPGPGRVQADYDRLMAARRAGPPPLRGRNPAVTPAVEAIVRKLLAPEPAARYQTAAELKEDVDRQLADRPLRFARDRSVAERARKWRRRNPRLLVAGLIAGVVLAAGGSGAYAVHAADGRTTAEARLKAQATLDQLHQLRLDLVITDEPVSTARGVNRARTLLADYGVPADPNWHDRESTRRLPDDVRASLAADLGEVAILYASARLAESRAETGSAAGALRAEAEGYVRAAASGFPNAAPPALTRLARELGLSDADPAPPATPRDHFLDAVEHLRAGRTADAAAVLDEVTFADPTHAAAQYLLGTCRDRLGQTDRAVERFAVAAALLPRDLRTYREWGRAELNARRPDRAVKVFDLSLRRSDRLEPAADVRFYRGNARLQNREYAGAADDFTAAIRGDIRPVASLLGRAAAREASRDPAGAAADRRALAALTPTTAADWTERGRAAEAADPAAARHDYEQAVAAGAPFPEPYRRFLQLALAQPGDSVGALRVAEAAVARFPERAEFHALRAQALARAGRGAEAAREVADLSRRSPDALDSFRAAAALARSSDAADRADAVRWLRRAYLSGFHDTGAIDTAPDFAELRGTAEYQAFRAAVGEMYQK